MNNITDVSTFTDPVTTLADGDPVAASSTTPTAQALANRTRFLFNRLSITQGLDVTNVSSGGSTITLTATNNATQVLQGPATAASVVLLPDATTIPLGALYTIINRTNQPVTVKAVDGSSVATIPATAQVGHDTQIGYFYSTNNTANTGSWLFEYNYAADLVEATSAVTPPASATAFTLTSVVLPTGVWDVGGLIAQSGGASFANQSKGEAQITNTAATVGAGLQTTIPGYVSWILSANTNVTTSFYTQRFTSGSSPTTVYMNYKVTYSSGPNSVYGWLRAQRVS